MANLVKAWRTVNAGPAQSLHEVVQPPFELALAQSAAHRDEALALVSADALVRRLCDRPNAVRKGVARENPAPVVGFARPPLRGPPLPPRERIPSRHATSMSAKNRVPRLPKPMVGGSSPPGRARVSSTSDAFARVASGQVGRVVTQTERV